MNLFFVYNFLPQKFKIWNLNMSLITKLVIFYLLEIL